MSIDKIKDRIKKLLRMAEDTSSPNEAAIAASRAQKLMRQYQLDHADIVMEDLDDPDQLIYSEVGESYRKMPGWMQSISVSIARATENQVRLSRTFNNRFILRFEGYKPDVELCEWLMTYLMGQIENQVKAEKILNKRFPADAYVNSPTKYLSSFREGLAAGIRKKLSEFYAEGSEQVSDTSRSMIIAKNNAIGNKFGFARYEKRSVSGRDRSAYAAGNMASRNVSVSRGITTGAPSEKGGQKLLS